MWKLFKQLGSINDQGVKYCKNYDSNIQHINGNEKSFIINATIDINSSSATFFFPQTLYKVNKICLIMEKVDYINDATLTYNFQTSDSDISGSLQINQQRYVDANDRVRCIEDNCLEIPIGQNFLPFSIISQHFSLKLSNYDFKFRPSLKIFHLVPSDCPDMRTKMIIDNSKFIVNPILKIKTFQSREFTGFGDIIYSHQVEGNNPAHSFLVTLPDYVQINNIQFIYSIDNLIHGRRKWITPPIIEMSKNVFLNEEVRAAYFESLLLSLGKISDLAKLVSSYITHSKTTTYLLDLCSNDETTLDNQDNQDNQDNSNNSLLKIEKNFSNVVSLQSCSLKNLDFDMSVAHQYKNEKFIIDIKFVEPNFLLCCPPNGALGNGWN